MLLNLKKDRKGGLTLAKTEKSEDSGLLKLLRTDPERGMEEIVRKYSGLLYYIVRGRLLLAGLSEEDAEAMEYRAAVRFFSENGLSSEGLTRGEMKEIYRDITADTFGEEKTAALVRKSLKGYRIEQEPETPEELKKAWSYRKYLREEKEKGTTDSRSYRLREEFREDPELGFEVFDRSILECYAWGEHLRHSERGAVSERISCCHRKLHGGRGGTDPSD